MDSFSSRRSYSTGIDLILSIPSSTTSSRCPYSTGAILLVYNWQTLRQLIFHLALLLFLEPFPLQLVNMIGYQISTLSSIAAYNLLFMDICCLYASRNIASFFLVCQIYYAGFSNSFFHNGILNGVRLDA